MPYPYVTGEGNLTGDPDVKWLDNGNMVVNVNVASTQRGKDRDGNWEDKGTTFLRLTLWNEDADALAAWATKGMAVRYEGRLVVREFEDREGGRGKSVELQYPVVTPDPKRMDIKARKRSRDDQQQHGQGGGGQSRQQGGGTAWGGQARQQGDQGAMKEGSGWGRTRGQGGGGGSWGGGQARQNEDPWASAPAAGGPVGYDDEPPF